MSDAPVVLDEFGAMAKERLGTQIAEYNGVQGQINAAGGDIAALRDSIKESDNEDVVKFRAEVEKRTEALFKAEQALDAYAMEQAEKARANSDVDIPALEAQAQVLLKGVRAATNYLSGLYGAEAIADLPSLQGKKRAGGKGDGPARIRGVKVFVNGEMAASKGSDGTIRSSFSAAAKPAGVETSALQEAFWAVAGRDPKAYPAVVEFTVTNAEGTEVAIRAERDAE